ncbi:hypothetical protein ACSQ67_024621 [Phaseolus vulgaris]
MPPGVSSFRVDNLVGATKFSSKPSDGVPLDINPVRVNDPTMALDRSTHVVVSEPSHREEFGWVDHKIIEYFT